MWEPSRGVVSLGFDADGKRLPRKVSGQTTPRGLEGRPSQSLTLDQASALLEAAGAVRFQHAVDAAQGHFSSATRWPTVQLGQFWQLWATR